MKKIAVLVGLALLLNSFAFGFTVYTKIDTIKTDLENLQVGDRIYFDVSVTHEKESSVHYVQQKPSEIFVILSYSTDIKPIDDGSKTDFRFTSAFFDTGMQTIPPQEFVIASSEDSVGVYSDSIQVMVHSILPADSVALKDIKPPVSLYLGFWDIALPLLIITIIIFVIILITRSKKGLALIPEKKKKILPAHVIALKKIEQLKLQDYIKKGDIKRYYVEVSWICREYLENRYHKPFLEMTGFEIRQALKDMNAEKRVETNTILQECDRVKFAKYIPPIKDAEQILNELIDVIYMTKEQEIEEEKNED
ncbi:MAG: hypothetical protein B1H05_03185 [Candidatus Cloacimonas sp. 4484_140]|nr:MAG: hypothetical protein B1H05_03185 [Candidatus Cloacimonas sp. 4484_140]